MFPVPEKAQARLWDKVLLPSTADGCLIWRGKLDGNGSPEFYADASRKNRKKVKARRYLWQLCTGTRLRRSVELSPDCDEYRCIAPNHMAKYGRGSDNPIRRYNTEETLRRKWGNHDR